MDTLIGWIIEATLGLIVREQDRFLAVVMSMLGGFAGALILSLIENLGGYNFILLGVSLFVATIWGVVVGIIGAEIMKLMKYDPRTFLPFLFLISAVGCGVLSFSLHYFLLLIG